MKRIELDRLQTNGSKHSYIVVKVYGRTSGFVWQTTYHGYKVWCSSVTGSCVHKTLRAAIRTIVKYYDTLVADLPGDAASRDTTPR